MSDFIPYSPTSMVWKINRELVVLMAGPVAAVLQVAHPQVARGVAAHSRFRQDTMGRLHRTLDAVYTVAFGTAEEVAKVRAGVRKAHERVRGEGYSAFDPGAQLWVLATLMMGSVTMYQRFVGPLSESDRDQFVMENRRFGEVFGLDETMLPGTWGEFEKYWLGITEGTLLGSDPLCAEVAHAVVHPEKPCFMRLLSPVLLAATAGLLPKPLQESLGLRENFFSCLLWKLLDLCVPALLRLLPRRLRFAPAYLKACARMSGR